MVRWLGLRTSTAVGVGSVTGQETEVLQAMWYSHKNQEN